MKLGLILPTDWYGDSWNDTIREKYGVVEMMLDATQRYHPHQLLNVYSDGTIHCSRQVEAACIKLQLATGALGKEKGHFQALDSLVLNKEILQFTE